MRLQTLTFSLLTSTALSIHHAPRQTTQAPDSFSSNAAQLISLYVPASIQSAIASAASLAGDTESIIESALLATTTPPWFSAIPSQYSSNIVALESAISGLRGAASTGIPGAPFVTTATDSAGSTFVSTVPGAGATVSSLESAASSAASSVLESASSAASAAASSASAAVSSIQSSLSAAASSHAASSSSSSGFAMPTQVPLAAAGVIGFVGAVLVL